MEQSLDFQRVGVMRILRTVIACATCLAIGSGSHAQTLPSSAPVARELYLDPNGLDLAQLVQLALTRNADLTATRQRTLEAQGLLRQAGFRPNPVFETEVSSGAATGSNGERQISVGYAHTFELGGKRSRRVEVAQSGVEIAGLEILDRERTLRAELQERYIAAMSAVRNFEAVAQQREAAEQGLNVTRQRVAAGESPRVEEMVLQADVGRLEAERLLLESEVQQAMLNLRVVAGFELTETLRLRPDGDRDPVTTTLEDALAKGLTVRPDLGALRKEEDRSAAEVRSARADRTPDIAALFRYTDAQSRFDQMGFSASGVLTPIRDHDRTLTGGLSITLPVLNRNQGMIQVATARQTAATLRREYQERVIRAEITGAYGRYLAARRAALAFQRLVIGPSEESVRVLRASYAAGEVQLFDVVAEQRRLIDTQKAYTEAIRQEALARVSLERAIGSPLK
jgi:cobalt-zinc-cadmium efflux system outer membrane protein